MDRKWKKIGKRREEIEIRKEEIGNRK